MRKSALLASAAVLALGGSAQAIVFGPGPGGAIPDFVTPTPGTLTSTITISGQPPTVASFNNISITMGVGPGPTGAHTWVGDLAMTIAAPDGTSAQFLVRPGATSPTSFGSSADLSGGPYVFVDSGGLPFPTGATPSPVPPGTYNRFNNPLVAPNPPTNPNTFAAFAGVPTNGVWTLTIQDWAAGDTGGLSSWTIDITPIPEPSTIGLLGLAGGLPLLRRRRA